MSKLRNFIEKQAVLDRLLNEFEFSDEADKVAISVFKAASVYQSSTSYRRLKKKDKVTFIFHIISLANHLHRIQELEEGLRNEK